MAKLILYASLASLLLSYLSSLRVFRLDLPRVYRQFSFFLLFVLIGEIFIYAWMKKLYEFTPFNNHTQWLYNIFHFFIYLFYLYFFYTIIESASIRRVIKWLTIVCVLFAVVNFFFIQGIFKLNTYSELLYYFLMVFVSIAYFYRLLHANEFVSLKNDPAFWISTGLLIFHLGSMMSILLVNVMNAISNEQAAGIQHITQFSAIIMYLSFSIGFLLCRTKK